MGPSYYSPSVWGLNFFKIKVFLKIGTERRGVNKYRNPSESRITAAIADYTSVRQTLQPFLMSPFNTETSIWANSAHALFYHANIGCFSSHGNGLMQTQLPGGITLHAWFACVSRRLICLRLSVLICMGGTHSSPR